MAVNIHITIIELNALHTKRQNLFQELDAVIHLLMEAKDRKSGSAGMPRPISYAVFCLKKNAPTGFPVAFHIQRSDVTSHIFAMRSNSGQMLLAFFICLS